MKKRDKYLLIRLLYFLLIIAVFGAISLVNIVKFNSSYMQEEQKELLVFTRQIEWAITPYLQKHDFTTLQKYVTDFRDEDITIRIFDKDKKMLASSSKDSQTEILQDDSRLAKKKHGDWKIYRHSLKDRTLEHVKELSIEGNKFYIELTISEEDVIGTIVKGQRNFLIFFGICILILLLVFFETQFRLRIKFNKFEDCVIKIANGELDTPIEIPNTEILEELSSSVKKMTIRLKNQIQRLTQLEEYKTDFLQNITHEIKTPITAISSAIELLESRNSVSEEDRECLNIIQFQIQSINKLVNDILILSELEIAKTDEKKQFKKFSLNSMIRKVADNFSHFKQKIHFITDSEIEFVGNEELMATALSNLLTNAIKYSETEKIDIILSKTDTTISLQVRDYGIGIPQKHIPHLFEKFYRIDKSRSKRKGGTGLGLTIVKNIVELHNATIDVNSAENVGTTFNIILNKGALK